MKQDFNNRIAIIIDKALPGWKAMNAVAHIAAHYGHHLTDNYSTGKHFTTKDEIEIPRNTQYPVIIFAANHSALLDFAQSIALREDIEKMYFVGEMIETTNDEEIQASLGQKTFSEVDYLGIGVFGDNSIVKSMTGKFKLWA